MSTMRLFSLVSLLVTASAVMGFVPASSFTRFSMSAQTTSTSSPTRRSLTMSLSKGDRVLLIGPGFLQLNIAKAAKAAGLKPMIIADKKKLETFATYVNDDELMSDATYGMPEVHEPGFGEIAGVVFCAEEAVLGPTIFSAVLDYVDKGESIFAGGSPKRVVACAPVTGVQQKEKSMGWIPILNNDKNVEQTWKSFIEAYKNHPYYKSSVGSLVRFGSLLGGSVDGIEELASLGLDEKMYKMSMEQYRDLKERAFDRFRIGAQVLPGNAINAKPPNQEKMEKEGISNDEDRESFRIVGGYPEIDRSNRHTVAQAVVQSLLRDVEGSKGVPKEMTVLSKCLQELPSEQDWDDLFANPGPSSWPDPYSFDVAAYSAE